MTWNGNSCSKVGREGSSVDQASGEGKISKVDIGMTALALSAIVGLAAGVLALASNGSVISLPKGLWTQVGALGGVAVFGTAAIVGSAGTQSKRLAVVMTMLTALAVPVLLGTMGATGILPAHNMLWWATAGCTAGVAGGFLYFSRTACCK